MLSCAVKTLFLKKGKKSKKKKVKKIPDTSDLAKKTDLNAKITKIENKIPGNNGLATNLALTAVGNKIPDVSSLVKKTVYDTKVSEIENKITNHNHDKYITIPEFNTLATGIITVRLADLVTNIDFDNTLQSLGKMISAC